MVKGGKCIFFCRMLKLWISVLLPVKLILIFCIPDIVHRDLKLENILLSQNPNDPTDKLHIKVSVNPLRKNKSWNQV